MEKEMSWKWKQNKKSGVAILVLDKIDCKTKAIERNKEGPSNSTSGYLFEETQTLNWKAIYIHTFIIALFITAKIWKQYKGPSLGEWIKKWCIYTMEYYSDIKKNKILPPATT